jgi:hypothetical protein
VGLPPGAVSLGQRWRSHGAVVGPLVGAAAFCLEPLADLVVHRGAAVSQSVALAEVTVGVVAALAGLLLHRRLAQPTQQLR